jgi:putative transcriptional regulator
LNLKENYLEVVAAGGFDLCITHTLALQIVPVGLTQEKFAALIQVDLSTLRNWEQGRREPTGPAKALIRAITNDPKHVLKALEVGESMRKAG